MLNLLDHGLAAGAAADDIPQISGICSTVSGVPCASSRTACLAICGLQAEVPHHLHDGLYILHRRAGNDSVAKIEDVPGTPVRLRAESPSPAVPAFSIGANSVIGSRLPCTAGHGPPRSIPRRAALANPGQSNIRHRSPPSPSAARRLHAEAITGTPIACTARTSRFEASNA